MVNNDTIRLLRECDSGIRMGVDAINELLPHAKSDKLQGLLSRCRESHLELDNDLRQALNRFNDTGKSPDPIVKGMSWLKTNAKIAIDNSDETIADLITDGCHMGVKSIGKYLNQYKAADEDSKDIAKRLIDIEDRLAHDMRDYL